MDQLTHTVRRSNWIKHHSNSARTDRQALQQNSGLLKTIFLKNLTITGSERSAGKSVNRRDSRMSPTRLLSLL